MERSYKYNNSLVKIKFGNILDSDADIIVSSDDCYVSMGGGVSMAIRNADQSGAILEDIKKKIPAELGDVVVTTAGSLPQKFIFHAITIGDPKKHYNRFLELTDIQEYVIKNSVTRCLEIMNSLNLLSIALPTIGGGTACFPQSRIAKVMSEAISLFLLKTNKNFKIEIVIFENDKNRYIEYLDYFEQFASKLPALTAIKYPEPTIDFPESERKNYDIFISYSRKDSEKADEIVNRLRDLNISVWIDRTGEYSGHNYKSVIVETIKASKLVLFLSSEHSNSSKNVIKEISNAVEEGKLIIPVRLDNAQYAPSIAYDLIAIDHIDYESENDKLATKIMSQLALMD